MVSSGIVEILRGYTFGGLATGGELRPRGLQTYYSFSPELPTRKDPSFCHMLLGHGMRGQ